MLEAAEPPLGILPELACVDTTVTMAPGDILMVASDGFPEANNESGEMLGYQRFMQMLDDVADRTAGQILEHLLDRVKEFAAGAPQSDDQTLIILKRSR